MSAPVARRLAFCNGQPVSIDYTNDNHYHLCGFACLPVAAAGTLTLTCRDAGNTARTFLRRKSIE
jgi:hypothetical protein